MEGLTEALAPLSLQHLGLLSRCFALSHPCGRAADAQALLATDFGIDLPVATLDEVFARLHRDYPHILGGPACPLVGHHGPSTIIQPAISHCPDCDQSLKLQPLKSAKAFFLHIGWVEVRYCVGICPSCRTRFSNVWRHHATDRKLCAAVAPPTDTQFLQIVACPRSNAKAFLEVRALWLLRGSLLRCKAPFSGFVEMMADLHGAPPDREHESIRFEHHWFIFETISFLWENDQDAAGLLWWPLEARHSPDAFQTTLQEAVLPLLHRIFQQVHFQQHSCQLCSISAVTFDAKYGLSCRLCNFREGGVVHFESIGCSIMFGCKNPPTQCGLYCLTHGSDKQDASEGPRILRHRDIDGVREYKVDGQKVWKSRGDVPAASAVEYETMLAEKNERRKRRRQSAAAAGPAPLHLDADPGETEYWDVVLALMRSIHVALTKLKRCLAENMVAFWSQPWDAAGFALQPLWPTQNPSPKSMPCCHAYMI